VSEDNEDEDDFPVLGLDADENMEEERDALVNARRAKLLEEERPS